MAVLELRPEIRCQGCKQLVGYGKHSRGVSCSIRCEIAEPPRVMGARRFSEERNGLMVALNRDGVTLYALADLFNVTVQRVSQITTSTRRST